MIMFNLNNKKDLNSVTEHLTVLGTISYDGIKGQLHFWGIKYTRKHIRYIHNLAWQLAKEYGYI